MVFGENEKEGQLLGIASKSGYNFHTKIEWTFSQVFFLQTFLTLLNTIPAWCFLFLSLHIITKLGLYINSHYWENFTFMNSCYWRPVGMWACGHVRHISTWACKVWWHASTWSGPKPQNGKTKIFRTPVIL